MLKLAQVMVTFIKVWFCIDNHTTNFSVLVVNIAVQTLLVFDITFQGVTLVNLSLNLVLVILFKVSQILLVASFSRWELGNSGPKDIKIPIEVSLLLDLSLVRPNYRILDARAFLRCFSALDLLYLHCFFQPCRRRTSARRMILKLNMCRV